MSSNEHKQKIIENMNPISKDSDNRCFLPVVEDPCSKAMLDIAHRAAKSKATVLITGETGVGKELVARYIHFYSPFSDGPFVSVNCAALPENMIEAILFGYEKGAFTSAVNSYVGKFEQAEQGTLLLDEISEIPLGLQAKLLRVLQEREIERLCGKKIIPIHLRIIAATNRELEQQVAAGLFRKDLYYRLNVLSIHCPPLSDRPLDIIPLAEYFVNLHTEMLGRNPTVLTHQAKKKLLRYTWPGNIRELDNVIQRALVMINNDVIDEADLDLKPTLFGRSDEITDNHSEQLSTNLKVNEARIILDVLRETDGCRDMAARKLNISPRTLRYKISKLKSTGMKVP
ncbi:MAG: sigma-54 dependent transcriptional regulator [Gammaproteobacteria bacterium]